ncbi:MAG: xylulokinase, partial [Phycisphaerae bacterium]
MGFLLGIDIGTSATKALLCDEAGKVLATASQPYQLYAPRPGWSEQAPTDWFNATLHTIAAVCKLARLRSAEISGIGLSGQMHGSVFVGRNGRPLRRALLWNDQRTAQQCAQIERAVGGRKRLIAMVSNAALTGFTAPKILWVRTHQPRIYDRTHKILLPKDYIRLCLTGQYATDVSDASGTILLDVRRRRWHHRLLARLGINPDLLPTCYESVQITGQLTRHASRLTGIPAGTPVVAGAGDQPAGAVGTGVIRSGVVSATIGTSGVVFAHCDQPAPNTHANLQSFCHAVPGKWCV